MSERDELIECLRVCGACHGCGIGADGDTCTNCGDERQLNRLAASLLERDGAELARLRAENERLKIEAARHETEMGEVIDERDEMESALSAAHVALGGDGEWACRVPSPPPPDSGHLALDVPALAAQVLARAEAAAREAVAAWMIEHAFATGHGDTLTDLLAELSWQIAEIKRDAIKWRDTPIPVPPGECPYPVHADHSIKACVDAGDCGCGQNKT